MLCVPSLAFEGSKCNSIYEKKISENEFSGMLKEKVTGFGYFKDGGREKSRSSSEIIIYLLRKMEVIFIAKKEKYSFKNRVLYFEN